MNLTISSIEPMMNTMMLTMLLSSSSMKIGMLSSTHGGSVRPFEWIQDDDVDYMSHP
jgi:hypothetical protein